MRRRVLPRALMAALLLWLVPEAAGAQSLEGGREWLPPGSLAVEALTRHPHEALAGGSGPQSFYIELGRLAFRSPSLLGGNARKAGLACQGCHPNGHTNAHFFVPELSDKPGRIDVSHAFWNLRAENNRFDPLDIPTLRGVAQKDRLGHDRRSASLKEFSRNVIVLEFQGAEPMPVLLDAVAAYLEALQPTAAPDEPVTFATDIADLKRALAVLRLPLLEENKPLSDAVALMLRGQIGFIHERFDGAAVAQAPLEDWSRKLEAANDLAQAGRWPEARRALAAIEAEIAEPPRALSDAVPRSLYDAARLKAWLSKPAP